MAAPTTAARVKKALANPEPSTHGPTLPTCAMHKVVSYLRYCGRARRTAATAVFVQVFGRRQRRSNPTLWRPASEKRQGTKSRREIGCGDAAGTMGILTRAQARM